MKMGKCLACECRVVEMASAVFDCVANKDKDRICKDSKFDEDELTKVVKTKTKRIRKMKLPRTPSTNTILKALTARIPSKSIFGR